jgi:hypothetical protein
VSSNSIHEGAISGNITIYGDASGGMFTKYNQLRRCGVGLACISEQGTLLWAIRFNLPGAVQTVARGELFAILRAAQLADEGDEVLSGNVLAANAFDMHSGFHLYSKEFFLMGSIHHMIGKSIQFTSYNENLSKHFTFIGGYNYTLEKQKLVIQPSIMVKYVDPVPVQWTGMLKATINDKYWAGINYRSDDAIGFILGYNVLNKLRVSYGFDYGIGKISQYQSGSHELVISFIITPDKPNLDKEDDKLNKSILFELNKNMNNK